MTGTVGGYVRQARRFLDGLAPGGLGGLTAADVTGAVLDRAASGVSVSATPFFVSGLRAFLRFCFVEGLLEVDLSPAALTATGRRRSSLPKAISRTDAQVLLESCDRRSALGRRDYALIIVLLRLGLRRGEVAALRLEDIDWRAGELGVHGKGGREDRLPLRGRHQVRRRVDQLGRAGERADEPPGGARGDGHREATVIAMPDERWTERPLARVVVGDADVSLDELREHVATRVAKWCVPDAFVFIDEAPKTSVGKFDKKVLRARLQASELDVRRTDRAPAQPAAG